MLPPDQPSSSPNFLKTRVLSIPFAYRVLLPFNVNADSLGDQCVTHTADPLDCSIDLHANATSQPLRNVSYCRGDAAGDDGNAEHHPKCNHPRPQLPFLRLQFGRKCQPIHQQIVLRSIERGYDLRNSLTYDLAIGRAKPRTKLQSTELAVCK